MIRNRILLCLTLMLSCGILATSCSKEEDYATVAFSSMSLSWNEDAERGSVQLKMSGTPTLQPAIVDVQFSPYEDGDLSGIVFSQTERFEVRQDSTTKVYFDIIDNDWLNDKPFKFNVDIVAVSNAKIGKITTCTVTITDDEKAPRLTTGDYAVKYPADTTAFGREDAGSFTLKLAKTGKYEYVAYNWFGMLRPRLVGVWDPEAGTLTFDGTDYDGDPVKSSTEIKKEDKFCAFGAVYYYYTPEMDQAIVFRGAGDDGMQPIVMTADPIAMNETAELSGFSDDFSVSMQIYKCETVTQDGKTIPVIKGDPIGIYDMMTDPEIEFVGDTRAAADSCPEGVPSLSSFRWSPAWPIAEVGSRLR